MSSVVSFRLVFIFATSLILLAGTLIAGQAQAEIYKWTDKHGQTHFSDRPPEHKQATEISGQLDSINISKELSSPEMMLQLENLKAREREQFSSEKQTQQERERSLSKACAQAKKALKALKGRVVFLDEQGNELKVTEAQRKQRAIEMENLVRQQCL